VSVARVTGTIRISIADGVPRLVIGEDGNESDQIKFRLSNCVFEYGDCRGEESYSHKWDGFLVVASSKGDTLSLFEPKN
jgi:hypothetical protein